MEELDGLNNVLRHTNNYLILELSDREVEDSRLETMLTF